MSLLLTVLLTEFCAPPILADEAELELRFDKTEIALGDVAYCHVEFWNRSVRPLKLEPPDPDLGVSFGILFRGGTHFTMKSVGGGGGEQVVLPGRSLARAARVVLWDREILEEWSSRDKILKVHATQLMHGDPHVLFPARPVAISIVNKPVASRDLLYKLYASSADRWDRLRKYGPPEEWGNVVDVLDVAAMPIDRMPSLRVTNSLVESIQPGSALHRLAAATRLIMQYEHAQARDFEMFKRELLVILANCGPAEREWLFRRVISGIAHRQLREETKELRSLDVEAILRTMPHM